jgi:preprotein translocase subunit SecB
MSEDSKPQQGKPSQQGTPPPQGSAPPQPSFQIEKLYVKDLSLEIPNAPQVFVAQVQPQLEVQIGTAVTNFAEALYEVTVSATVTARTGEQTVFLAEAVQAGIFSVRNVPKEDLEPLLAVGCPTIVFPYLRETISDLVVRGGFPPVLLSPVSFEALYMQRLQQQQQGAGQPQPGQQRGGPQIEIAR